ncbi:kelch-like protein 33 [Latimeria chalumnae]|uniref:kelch-like protein 33 n=1 Tax=Latimeria chalumnae TaxID=7897 RepID=UPI00313E992D
MPSKEIWFAHQLLNGIGLVKTIDWRHFSSMPAPPRFRHGVAVLNNMLYIFGGSRYYGERDILKSVIRFDVAQQTWEQLEDMKEPRNYFAAVCLNGLIYAIGGNKDDCHILKTVECYDPDAKSWRMEHPLEVAVCGHASAVWNGEIYISGGCDTSHRCLETVFRYDPRIGSTYLRPMKNERGGHVMEAIGDRLYVAGGLQHCSRQGYTDQHMCEVYDPQKDAWAYITSLSWAHVMGASAVLEDKLYILGGYCFDTYKDSYLVHRYDPKMNSWVSMGTMPSAYADTTACVVSVPPYLRQ